MQKRANRAFFQSLYIHSLLSLKSWKSVYHHLHCNSHFKIQVIVTLRSVSVNLYDSSENTEEEGERKY